MKKQKLLLSMDLIDEAYIREADPALSKKRFNWKKFSYIAASIALVLTALNLWLFIPYEIGGPPSVAQYANSEYYPLIQKLNSYYHPEQPTKTNNYEQLMAKLENLGVSADGLELDYSGGAPVVTAPATGLAPAPGAVEEHFSGLPQQEYEEVTDNQVAGVIEADLMKRSDKYIYYLYNGALRVYSIEGDNSQLIKKYIYVLKDDSLTPIHELAELYLSTDCKTVTVIQPCSCRCKVGAL